MAQIAIDMVSIKGGCEIDGFKNQVEAIAVRETIEAGVRQDGGGTGQPNHSDIQLIRYKDAASPKFAEKCAAGDELGNVTISVLRMAGNSTKAYMQYVLTGVYVSRIESETLDEANAAMGMHLTESARGRPLPGAVGMPSVLAPVVSQSIAVSRPAVLPVEVSGGFSDNQIERLSLHPETVTWVFTTWGATGTSGGTVRHGFDLLKGKALTT